MKKRIIFTILSILWMGIIFGFSSKEAVESSKDSRSFITSTIVNIYKLFDSDASDEKINDIVEMFNTPVRKLAHFSEYFILGLLIALTFKAYGINNIYLMILFCFLYAVSDEVHQLFVVGRYCSFFDVVVDTLGSSTAITILKKRRILN